MVRMLMNLKDLEAVMAQWKYYPSICLERLRKPKEKETSIRGGGVPADIRT
jgi:hypothetical protein